MAAIEESYIFHGFNTEASQQLLDELVESDNPAVILAREKILHQYGVDIYYSLPGLPLCWKCTFSRLMTALGKWFSSMNYLGWTRLGRALSRLWRPCGTAGAAIVTISCWWSVVRQLLGLPTTLLIIMGACMEGLPVS